MKGKISLAIKLNWGLSDFCRSALSFLCIQSIHSHFSLERFFSVWNSFDTARLSIRIATFVKNVIIELSYYNCMKAYTDY